MKRAQPERAFQNGVVEFAQVHGWVMYHPPDNRPGRSGWVQHMVPGFPDLTLVRRDRLVFAELKAKGGRATPEQKEWLALLAAAGAETYLWKPADWPEIEATLA